MKTYDHTLKTETINEILRGLMRSPDINKSGSRDSIRALQLLEEKKRRANMQKYGKSTPIYRSQEPA